MNISSAIFASLVADKRELAEVIGGAFKLEAAIIEQLVFHYTTHFGTKGNSKIVYFNNNQTISGVWHT